MGGEHRWRRRCRRGGQREQSVSPQEHHQEAASVARTVQVVALPGGLVGAAACAGDSGMSGTGARMASQGVTTRAWLWEAVGPDSRGALGWGGGSPHSPRRAENPQEVPTGFREGQQSGMGIERGSQESRRAP